MRVHCTKPISVLAKCLCLALALVACQGQGPSVSASRSFVSPGFPPDEFSAFGIVAFPALATPETKERYLQVCRAYWSVLPETQDLDIASKDQMVTVWPVDQSIDVKTLRDPGSVGQVCDIAVSNYHMMTALQALNDARSATGQELNGLGPYLLAWSPGREKGKAGVVILIMDLSPSCDKCCFCKSFSKLAQRHPRKSVSMDKGMVL